jgi:hypothetical protein
VERRLDGFQTSDFRRASRSQVRSSGRV